MFLFLHIFLPAAIGVFCVFSLPNINFELNSRDDPPPPFSLFSPPFCYRLPPRPELCFAIFTSRSILDNLTPPDFLLRSLFFSFTSPPFPLGPFLRISTRSFQHFSQQYSPYSLIDHFPTPPGLPFLCFHPQFQPPNVTYCCQLSAFLL